MIVINAVLATEEDIQEFYNRFTQGEVSINYIKVGETYTNIVTD